MQIAYLVMSNKTYNQLVVWYYGAIRAIIWIFPTHCYEAREYTLLEEACQNSPSISFYRHFLMQFFFFLGGGMYLRKVLIRYFEGNQRINLLVSTLGGAGSVRLDFLV